MQLPLSIFFLTMMARPRPTLFPYTTLFRSLGDRLVELTRRRQFGRSVGRARDRPHATGVGTCEPPDYRRRSEEHTSELQSRSDIVCRLLLEKKKAAVMIVWHTRPSSLRHAL